MKTLLLIDANSFIHRAFHAIPPLTSPEGKPTGALYGLTNTVLKAIQDIRPDYIAAAFDRPEPTFRKKMYEAYKATRPKAPDELISQIKEARNLLEKLNIPIFEKAGYEADDLIGTLAEKFKKETQAIILTGDMDSLQLVEDDCVKVYAPKKGLSEMTIYGEKEVVAKLGVKPNQVTDYKGLVGDSSDNIPGVTGVGPKTATAALEEFEHIENLYQKIKPDHPLAKKFLGREKDALTSKTLAIIERKVPLEIKLEDLTCKKIETEKISDYFAKLGFQTLLKRLGAETKKAPAEIAKPKPSDENIVIVDESIIENGLGVLVSPKIKVAENWKNIFKKYNTEKITPPYFDLQIAGWLLDPDKKDVSLEALTRRFLRKDWDENKKDTILGELFNFLKIAIEREGLHRVFYDIELPLIPILADIETRGISADKDTLQELKIKLDSKLVNLEDEIFKTAGMKFNINSPKQLSEVVFGKILTEEKKTKTTKTGQKSTAEDVLKELAGKHPIIPKILEYRETFKIQTTYAEPLREDIKNGKIHTHYIQTGTSTGRLSSEKPNLQNIPTESKWARALRAAFKAEKGTSFAAFDYSQLDLRVLADATGDSELKKAFENGADIHSLTISKVLKIDVKEVTKDMRRLGKTLNFGIIYGMGPRAFAKTSGISVQEASEFIKKYFAAFPSIKKWHEDTISKAGRLGYVTNKNGRKRLLPQITSGHQRFRSEAERAAINMPIQGMSADILKTAMVKTIKLGNIVLSIHDELIFEIPDDMLEKTIPEIKRTMEQACDLSVPLRVEIKTGKNWGEIKPYKTISNY